MARSDLLITLVKAALGSNRNAIVRTVEALAAEERAKRHHGVASRLEEALQTSSKNARVHDITKTQKKINSSGRSFLFEYNPDTELKSLILPENIKLDLNEFIEEQHRSDILRAHGMEPRSRILLAGPPGNGKTSLAEALAHELALPLLMIRYDQLIGSFLGESAAQLREVFEYARTQRCVLFFDEFDAVSKNRGDQNETGEIRRLVNSLLMQVDHLPSYTIVVAATNFPELLDRAIWRRFQLRALLPAPTTKEIKKLLDTFFSGYAGVHHQTLTALAKKLDGASLAEIEDFSQNVIRRHILSLEAKSIKECINEAYDRWKHRFILSNKEKLDHADAGSPPNKTAPQGNKKQNQRKSPRRASSSNPDTGKATPKA